MKIAFNPSTVAALTAPPNNKDITFDLRGRNIFARGVKFYGTDTNTWRDIKVNNVSIGSHTLDLRNGSNTTLTNTNGVVIINSTWRPVVDNLTSDSTTSSLSANQGRVLAGLINGKSDSDHNHDGRYLKLTGGVLKGQIILPDIDVNTSYTGSIIIGSSNTENLGIDGNEIMARNNGKASTLYLNNEGGAVQLGAILRTNSNIAYMGGQSTQDMIKFINNTSDSYGNGIAIGGGGLTIIGSGESSDVVMGQHSSGGDENMIIAGDGNIDFYSNLQNGWKYGKHMYLDTNGFLFTPSYINIGGNENNNSSPDRVWGSNSGDSFLRSYRTSALKVAYANSAGNANSANHATNADKLDGYHYNSFAPFNGVKFTHMPGDTTWHRILQFTTNWVGQVTFMYSPEEYQRDYWGIFNINIRSKDIWFRGFSFANVPQIKCIGDDNNNWSVWVKGNTGSYDPYGVIQVLNYSSASIINVGLDKSQTTEPSGTYNRTPELFYAGFADWNNITNKPSSFTPSAHEHNYVLDIGNNAHTTFAYSKSGLSKDSITWLAVWNGYELRAMNKNQIALSGHTHTWTSITDKIVAGNEFNIVNAGFKEDLWFNYLPINDKSKSATIKSYRFANGNRGYTSLVASGFIINGGTSQQLLRADGGVATFNWSGQSGQPTWLWGGNSQHSYYVYNPSNFRVAYAASAGNANTLDGEHASNFVRAGNFESSDLNKLDTYSFIKSAYSTNKDTSPKGNIGWYNVIQAVHRNGASDGPGYIGQIALGMTINTDDMFFRGKRTDPWKTVIHSGNIGSQSVAYASNADMVDGYHATSNNNKPWGTIPAITPSGFMDIGKHLEFHYDNTTGSDYSTALMCQGNYSNIVYLPTASGTLALTSQVLTWKSQIIDMRSYSESYWHPVTVPLPYTGYNKIKVSVQLNSGDKPSWATHSGGITCNMEIWATASGWETTDSDTICLNYTYKFCSQNPCGWMQLGNPSLGVVFLRGGSRYTVYTDFDATFTPHNQKYTWSSGGSSQDTGGPYTSCPGLNFNMNTIRADLIATLVQARRVCAGHDPGIDNSISCSNWFRSSGNTGWYNTTYQGGWYMSDTSWIRAHNGVGIYTGGQIYAGSSIRMGSIRLERTNEINSSDNLFINYGSSTNVSLCNGGGNVGIGTISPTQKLDVNGNTTTKGFGIQPCYLSELNSLPTISPGDGYKYKCLEIGRTTDISCIIADKAGLMSERGILIKFNKGYDGQIILLKDLQSYGIGNGYFWVMPSGCNIIRADGSSILVGQNQISDIYNDGRSRFLVYSSVHSIWIEFLCANIN